MTTAAARTPDPGLFGPDSVTWRLHADPVAGLGGLRALLLQALHPLAMAGVEQHSDFRADPWGRLYRTAEYVAVVSYGTTAEARAAGNRVRGAHARLGGIEPDSGQGYRVDDPALLLWVHCCLVDSFLTTYRRAGGPLTAADADTYVAEQVVAATLVGLSPDRHAIPDSTATLAAYFTAQRPALRATRAARRAATFVLAPPMPGLLRVVLPARLGWAGVAGLAAATLPRWARRLYGLPAVPTTDIAATAVLRSLRTATLAIPEHVRTGPHLRAARQRLALPG